MYELLKRYLGLNIPVDEKKLNEIAGYFKPLTANKNAILLSHGEVCNNFYFVNKGCVRTYYLTEQGTEKTRYIAMEGIVITSLSSFISQQPSFELIEVLESTELLAISRNSFFRMVENIPEWEQFYRKLLEYAYLFQNKKIEQLVTLTAGERYAALMMENPHFVLRLSNKILASYLDLTPETLSRIKSAGLKGGVNSLN